MSAAATTSPSDSTGSTLSSAGGAHPAARPVSDRRGRSGRSLARSRRFAAACVLTSLLALGSAAGCATQGLRPAVSMKVERHEDTPKSALVYIDEQYMGTLGFVASRGVRLPEGKHRISVEKTGYFPYDVIVVSDREPIHLDVRLQRLPD